MQHVHRLYARIIIVLLVLFGVGMMPPSSEAQQRPGSPGQTSAGAIIATQEDRVSVGAGDHVIVDRGRLHGVEAGDRFYVLHSERPVVRARTGRLLHVPREVIGVLLVTDVEQQTSRALIMSSQLELSVGAPIASEAVVQSHQSRSQPDDPELVSQAQARLQRLASCLETSRQAVHAAAGTRTQAPELLPARRALGSATLAFEQSAEFLNQGDAKQALTRLEGALADCLTAQDVATQMAAQATGSGSPPGSSPVPGTRDSYTVARGDALWSISARETIYNNPLLWPIIYKANREHIRVPERIFPQQILVIPRDYSQAEAEAARRQARQRHSGRL